MPRTILAHMYRAGSVPSEDDSLQISYNAETAEVVLGSERPQAHRVVFPEGRFVEMVVQSGIPTTERLVRVWLCTIYNDVKSFPWARTL